MTIVVLWSLTVVQAPAAPAPTSYRGVTARIESLGSLPLPSEQQKAELQRAVALAAKSFPDEPGVLYWVGDVAEREGKGAEAEAAWKAALEKRSASAPAETSATQARCCQRLGYRRLTEFDGSSAEAFARQAIALAPADPRGYQLLADASLRTGKVLEAMETLRQAVADTPNAPPALRALYWESLAQLGEWERLRQAVDERLRQDPLAFEARHFAGRLAERSGDLQAAFIHHFIAAENGPADLKITQRSKESIGRVALASPDQLGANLRPLAEALALSERPDAAQEALAALKNARPADDSEAVVMETLRGLALSTLGKQADAIATWQSLLDRHPDYLPALAGLAEWRFTDKDVTKARELLARARKLSPANARAHRLERLGGEFRVHKNGVEVIGVRDGSALSRHGINVGDVFLQLDSQRLADLAPIDRLRAMWNFQGGEVEYQTPEGEKLRDEWELILFPY